MILACMGYPKSDIVDNSTYMVWIVKKCDVIGSVYKTNLKERSKGANPGKGSR
jgi:CBS-domain-containing membrane protein